MRPLPDSETKPARPARGRGVTWRAILIGLVLIPIHVYWDIVIEVGWYNLDSSCLPLFVTPIFILFALVLANMLWDRLRPGRALAQGELLTVYIMQVLAIAMAGHDTLQNLMGTIVNPAWQPIANPEVKWPQTFYAFLNRSLFLWNERSLRPFMEGHSTAYLWANLRPWLAPLAWWTLFVMVTVAMFLAITVLVRRAWTEQEKLAFPIIQLPLAITDGGARTGFFNSRLMWAGFALAAAINALNGFHYLFPSLPSLPVRIGEVTIRPQTWPWNRVDFPLSFYPFAIGLAYFLPLDLSFSCWFFYLFRKFQTVGSAALGWDRIQDFPYIPAQTSGAWLGFALVIAYGMRRYLAEVFLTALGRKTMDDSREPLRYRTALLILVVGSIFLIFWGRATHMKVWAVFAFFGICFLLGLAITRVRAELGAPHEVTFWGFNPQIVMVSLFGTQAIGVPALTGMAAVYWINRGYRNHPMPNQLEAFKMAEATGMDTRRLVWVMLLALGVATLSTYWAHLHLGYHDGMAAKAPGFKYWSGAEGFNQVQNWVEFGSPGQEARRVAMTAGFVMVVVLRFLRTQYLWWPFHPAGYALGMSYAMDYFWFAFFVSWLIKLVLVHYGGMKTHRAAIPFFLGMILGDYVTGSLWSLYGPAKGIVTYKMYIRN